jgi:hypothetical protein
MNLEKSNVFAKLENIRTLDGVCAIEPDFASDFPAGASISTTQNAINLSDAQAFENAGWKFIMTEKPCLNKAVHDVVVDHDGHLKILTRALNVKFGPSVSKTVIETILGRFRLSMRRNMRFSPNLFLVEDFTGNAISTAKSLNKLDDVVYAEPVLIEAIGQR